MAGEGGTVRDERDEGMTEPSSYIWQDESVHDEPQWLPCKVCGVTKPVAIWDTSTDAGRLPVCRDDAAFVLQLHTFPTPLEEVPIVHIEDPEDDSR